jgi:hypothetical protein
MYKSIIHSNQFTVLEVDKNTGRLSIVDNDSRNVYGAYPEALHAAQELAAFNKGSKFIVVAIAAVCEMRPIQVPVVTYYKL